MSIKTRVGRMVEVINQNKKRNSSDTYYSVILRGNAGVHEFLFTKVELDVALSRARKNVEDTLEQSFISKIID
jgi:hypothetical protein